MSLTEHAILHRRVKKRFKGSIKESHPGIDYVSHVVVSELKASEINRDLFGARVEGDIKVIIWGADILTTQDGIELNGNVLDIGKADMYELITIIKDNIRVANFAVYAFRRLQKKVVPK